MELRGSLKRALRRVHLLGRGKGREAQCNVLYAARAAKAPGWSMALKACAEYRKAMNGVTGPLHAFDLSWIKFVGESD